MTERTFFVRVNLDDMAAEIIGLDSTEERGLWLEGFIVGSRGKSCREDWQGAKLEGHSFGLRCFTEAEEFRGKQSAKGLASVEARRNRKTTADQPDFNHGSTTVQPDINQTSTYPTTNNQQPITNNEQPKKARQAAFSPSNLPEPSEESMIIGAPTRGPRDADACGTRDPRPKAEGKGREGKGNDLHASGDAADIYQLYPRKEARADAIRAIEKALRKVPAEVLKEAVAAFAKAQEGNQTKFIPHPASWFNAERWTDDRAAWSSWRQGSGFAPAPAQAQRPAATRELTYEQQQQLLPMSQRWKS